MAEYASLNQIKRGRILNIIRNLSTLPHVTVDFNDADDGYTDIIEVEHSQEYVPNFTLEWCYLKNHYRVYINVASQTFIKQRAGYCIFVIPSPMAAIGFCTLYSFIHKHRANNKLAAV